MVNQFYHLSKIDENKNVQRFERQLLKTLKNLINRHNTTFEFKKKEITLFKSFIENESLEKFSLEKTAFSFGLNKYKFLRLFKQETGLTPNSFLTIKRLEKCKELLKTNDDLLDIAIQTGFYDSSHLIKNFKKYIGVTPFEYK